MVTRLMYVCVGIILVGALPISLSSAQPHKGVATLKKVTFKKPELDDYALAQLFHNESMSGAYELSAAPRSIAFVLEFYQNGKKVEMKEISAAITDGDLPPTGEFALQMVDMDQLKLGNGKANHWRM